ncbi:unnamed protein product, partial [Leptidea sinapis]
TQEDVMHFNMARKTKINQQILDGFLDPIEAISEPSTFPYPKKDNLERKKVGDDDEEFSKEQKERRPNSSGIHARRKEIGSKSGELNRGGGPTNKPKPCLLIRASIPTLIYYNN